MVQVRNSRRRLWVASGLAASALAGAAWRQADLSAQEPRGTETARRPAVRESSASSGDASAAIEHGRQLSRAFRQAAETAIPTVVTIESRTRPRVAAAGRDAPQENPFRGTPFENFFDDEALGGLRERMVPQRQGTGSGVIVDPSGVILTNNHVVAGADAVTVRLADGREFRAVEIKTDPRTDLAVLRIEGAGELPAARLGDSDALEIGDWVIAVGNPFNLDHTVSAGIISGEGRKLSSGQRAEYLQTDAAINPGNSGGPLLNLEGEVVGVNTAIASNNGSFQGVGFAIPSNTARWVMERLIEKGQVERAYLGVVIEPVRPELAEQLGVQPDSGALVAQVNPDTPAAEAGVQPGDIITRFGESEVTNPSTLQTLVERTPADAHQDLEVLRGGERQKLEVVLRAMPDDFDGPAGRDRKEQRPNDVADAGLGLSVAELEAEVAEQLGVDPGAGVVITRVDPQGLGAEAGLAEGMVIVRVGNRPVTTPAEFQAAMEDASLARGVLLLVRTAAGSRHVVVRQQ